MRSLHLVVWSALALVLWSATLAPSCPAEQCGCDYGCRHCKSCCPVCQPHFRHHERKLAAPPQAPVLGAAPAMMAPIVFAPAGPTAYSAPAPYQAAPQCQGGAQDREAIKELLRAVLDGSSGKIAGAAPLAAPQPPPESAILERLDRIEGALLKLDGQTADAITRLEARIRALEGK
jgi:hypothetical protein